MPNEAPYPQQTFNITPQQAFAALKYMLIQDPAYRVESVDDARMSIAFILSQSGLRGTAAVFFTPDGRANVQLVPTNTDPIQAQSLTSQFFNDLSKALANQGQNTSGIQQGQQTQPVMLQSSNSRQQKSKFSVLTVFAIIFAGIFLILAITIKAWSVTTILIMLVPAVILDGFSVYNTCRKGGKRGAVFAWVAVAVTVVAVIVSSVWAFKPSRDETVATEQTVNCGEYFWPESDVSAMLNEPKSKSGEVVWENSSGFFMYVCDTSQAQFDAYVKDAREQGFKEDYRKGDDFYYATAPNGNTLSLNYKINGKNIMSIRTEEPAKSSTPTESSESTSTSPSAQESASQSATAQSSSVDIRKAIDDYESFMNKYVDFMNKYQKDGSPSSMMKDYSEMMQEYSTMAEKWSKLDTSTMSQDDVNYYMNALTRINAKLETLQ
jgi:uncharacterized membrane protein YecN with MAPEG domain